MKRSLVVAALLLVTPQGGCAEDSLTMHARVAESEGLDIEDGTLVAVPTLAGPSGTDLQFSHIRYQAYGFSGVDYRDRMCPVAGAFRCVDDIPIDANCEGAINFVNINEMSNMLAPKAIVYERARDGERFRLLVIDHGIEDRVDGTRAFVTFEISSQ